MDLETTLRRNLLRFLVQRAIFCPYTGTVLDMDTCAYVNDADGDPHLVMSPEAGKVLAEKGLPESLTAQGYTLVVQ